MEKLRHYKESNLDQEFNGYNECEKIVLNNMKENFRDLCLSIQQFLDTDKQRYISQFCMIKLCLKLTQKQNEEFLFAHFQNIVLPSIINYIYHNQMYSKELDTKVQQYILSSVILCQELVSFWAHAYPQTQDFSTSKFLSEYQIYKKQQKENKMVITKKSNYTYLQQNFSTHQVYKVIKDKWKRQNLISEFSVSDEETDTQPYDLSNKFNSQSQSEDHQDHKKQIIINDQRIQNHRIEAEKKEELQQILDNLQKQIDEKKKELDNLEAEIQKKAELLANSISSQPKTNDSEQSGCSGILGSSIQGKDIFDSIFEFDSEKFPIKTQYEDTPLVSIDTSYPQKKRRLLDGKGVFHVHENFILARQYRLNNNTLDVAIYLKCIEKPMQDVSVQIHCEGSQQIQSNFKDKCNNLKPEQQIKFEIKNIEKSLLCKTDIKIELIIDEKQNFPEIISFYLKLTNIVSYSQANLAELQKEYQNIPKVLISNQFLFDSETFPNGLEDVQKCIPNSINDKEKNQLLLSGSLNNNSFICRITLDQEGKAQVIIKKLQNEELAKRLILSYIEALQKN